MTSFDCRRLVVGMKLGVNWSTDELIDEGIITELETVMLRDRFTIIDTNACAGACSSALFRSKSSTSSTSCSRFESPASSPPEDGDQLSALFAAVDVADSG